MARPACTDEADTTVRLNALEDAAAGSASAGDITDLQSQVDALTAALALLDARVVVLEEA